MILADSGEASLKAALNWWEWFGYISTAIVCIGCVGEFVAEFTSLPKSKESEHKLARLSLMVLILGIAGELLGTVRTAQLSGQLIASIEERTANAEQRAGDANRQAGIATDDAAHADERAGEANKAAGEANERAANANERASRLEKEAADARADTEKLRKQNLETEQKLEDERATRLDLEESLLPRLLPVEYTGTRADFEPFLKAFAGQKISIMYTSDGEVRQAAGQIKYVLDAAGWKVIQFVEVPATFRQGVTVFAGKDGLEMTEPKTPATLAARSLTEYLRYKEWNALQDPGNSLKQYLGIELPEDEIKLTVGLKPNPYLEEVEADKFMEKQQLSPIVREHQEQMREWRMEQRRKRHPLERGCK